MSAVKKPCTYPGCRVLLDTTGTSRCSKHSEAPYTVTPEQRAQYGKGSSVSMQERRERHAYYLSPQWAALRRAVLMRTRVCAHCKQRTPTHVDHIIPRGQQGSSDDMSNLQALCRICHSRKTAAKDGAFGNARKDETKQERMQRLRRIGGVEVFK